MILEFILLLTLITAISSILSIITNKKYIQNSISIKKYMPGDLPVITLTNNNVKLNFLIDTGSNISHICPSVISSIVCEHLGTNNTTKIAGLGATTIGIANCLATFKDELNKEYTIQLSISKELENTVKYIKESTGTDIHGLLGTDFLQKYKYTIDFKTLEVYTK